MQGLPNSSLTDKHAGEHVDNVQLATLCLVCEEGGRCEALQI